ncbi:MAG: enoyl-CoA hydratase/isomerase family protein [Novosphingobium sp.]|nr:enoyl-CoA hydratase/isomerase family protein [Novosphingobium sp.]
MSADQGDLLIERRDDGIVVATLNRPKARNTVSFDMWEAFGELLSELESDTPARALILQGAENYFSSGGDVKIPPARGEGALRLGKRLEIGQRALSRLQALPMPTIAAVETGAWGVAWGMTLCCDLVFAGESTQFGAPFVNLGIVPDGGIAWHLTQRLGRGRASDILLSCRVLGTGEAKELGLLTHVVPDGQALDAALAYAANLGEGNRQAVEITKRLIHEAEASSLDAALALELAYCHITQGGEELARARAAFLARSEARKAKG